MTKYYTQKEYEAFKSYLEDVENSNALKEKKQMKVVTPMLIGNARDIAIKGTCSCGGPLKLDTTDYSKPLSEEFVECPKGEWKDGHGLWAQRVSLILN